jgi:putative tricarboxylic transport membrane protein
MADLVTQMRTNPASVFWGGVYIGSMGHIVSGMIAQAVGIEPDKINYIAYAGDGALQAAIIGDHVTASEVEYGDFEYQIRTGKLRALGISAPQRLPGVNIPTLKEQGVDIEFSNWRALFAPPGITEAERNELISLMDKAVNSAAWKETLLKNAWNDMYLTGDSFKNFLEAEQARITSVIEALNFMKP